jgi:hypothetical protein
MHLQLLLARVERGLARVRLGGVVLAAAEALPARRLGGALLPLLQPPA